MNARTEGRTEKIIELVSCGAAYTMRDLTTQLGIGASYLRRQFRQHTTMGLGAWLVEQRMQRAAHLLQHTHRSVKEIAFTVGYRHVSSFIRAFERRFNQGPTRYRRQLWRHSTQEPAEAAGETVLLRSKT
jgi:AraC-like DNA-binding protein